MRTKLTGIFPGKHLLPAVALLAGVCTAAGTAHAMTCPRGPEQMAVSIPNPNPPPAAGNFAMNIDGLLSYFQANNIRNTKEFINHFPRVLNSHYTIVERTGALHQTSLTHPGLMVWGDGRFMINMGTNPNDPRYEVVDIIYLKPNGDWQFDAIDFRSGTPTRRGNGECIQCHGTPPRPIWGNYLDWPGMFSDNGQGQEILTSSQASSLRQIKSRAPTSTRFHKLEIASYLFDQAGAAMHLPNHAYGPALTISNTEMGAAIGESIYKRSQRSARYRGLREEYLALSYCDTYAGVLSSTKKTQIGNLIKSLGGTTTGYAGAPHWTDIYRLWGINPNHELAVHLKTGVAVGAEDLNWNTGVSRLRETVDNLILWEMAQENTSIRSILQSYRSSYPMTSCGILFPNMYQHTQHKIYALHTLRGNARWAARTGNGNSNLGYYDIDYLRIHQSWDYIRSSLCNQLTASVSAAASGAPASPAPASTDAGLTAALTPVSNVSSAASSARAASLGSKSDTASSSKASAQEPSSTAASTIGVAAEPNVQALLKGVPRTGLSGAAGSVQYFTLHVHGAPPTNLVFKTSGGTGDVDMYVKHGSLPTTTNYQCRPYTSNNNETCSFPTVAEGSWYVMLRGYRAYSGVTLTGNFNDNNTTPPPPPPPDTGGGTVPNACATKAPVYDAPLTKGVVECVTGSPGPGYYRHFYIRLAAADAGRTLVVKMGNGTGNANMLVSTDLGLFPHEEHYAARPDIVFGSNGPTNEETVTIPNAKSGRDYLITLPAVTAHSGISIVATVQ